MINDNYLEGMASLASGNAYTIISHIAFGSTTGGITATDIETSGEFDRNAIDSTAVTGKIAKYIGSRSSVEGDNKYINVIGFHNSATLYSSDNLQSNFLVPSLLHTSSFDIEVELWVEFGRA